MKKSRSIETLVIGLLFLSGLGSGYAFVVGSSVWNPLGVSGKRIGMLLSEERGIRFKPKTAAIWREVAKHSVLDVSGGDSVHTGSDVATLVRLEAGPTLEISPDSLVVFKSVSKSSGLSLKVVTGQLKFKASPESSTSIEIESQGRIYQIEPPSSKNGEGLEWVFKSPEHAGDEPVVQSSSGEQISFKLTEVPSSTLVSAGPTPEPSRLPASDVQTVKILEGTEARSSQSSLPVKVDPIIVPSQVIPPVTSPIRIWLGLNLNQFKIEGADTLTSALGTVLSTESPGIDFMVDFDLDDYGKVSSAIRSTRYQLMALKGSRKFNSDSVFRTEIDIEWQKKLGSELYFGAGISFDRDLFIRSEDENSLIVESVPIVKPNVKASYGLVERNRIRLTAEVGAGFCLPSAGPGYKIYTGWEGQLGSMITYRSIDDTRFIRALMNYTLTVQNSSITSRTFQELVFGFQYGWRLGW